MIKRKSYNAEIIITYDDSISDHDALPDKESEPLVVLGIEMSINSMPSVDIEKVGRAYVRLHIKDGKDK